MEPGFVSGEPALLIGCRNEKILVVADLHIGIEYDYYIRGIRIPSQSGNLVKRLDRLIEKTGADRLVFLGDVKHKVPGISRQELREIPDFFNHFTGRLKVDVVPGNHDGGIKACLPKKVRLHKSSGFRLGDFFLSHGHCWPAEGFSKARYLVSGHNHPHIEFRSKLGYRWSEPVWVRAKLDAQNIKKRYGAISPMPELIIMPCFNVFAGGVALNRENVNEERKPFLGPLINNINTRYARIYMLDGVYLGELSKL